MWGQAREKNAERSRASSNPPLQGEVAFAEQMTEGCSTIERASPLRLALARNPPPLAGEDDLISGTLYLIILLSYTRRAFLGWRVKGGLCQQYYITTHRHRAVATPLYVGLRNFPQEIELCEAKRVFLA